MNAIAQAAKNGSTIKDGAIYITHTPCIHCLKVLVNTGIKEIFYLKPYKLHTLEELLRYTQVHLVPGCSCPAKLKKGRGEFSSPFYSFEAIPR